MANTSITRKEFEALIAIPRDQRSQAQQARVDLWFEIGDALGPDPYGEAEG